MHCTIIFGIVPLLLVLFTIMTVNNRLLLFTVLWSQRFILETFQEGDEIVVWESKSCLAYILRFSGYLTKIHFKF